MMYLMKGGINFLFIVSTVKPQGSRVTNPSRIPSFSWLNITGFALTLPSTSNNALPKSLSITYSLASLRLFFSFLSPLNSSKILQGKAVYVAPVSAITSISSHLRFKRLETFILVIVSPILYIYNMRLPLAKKKLRSLSGLK